MKAKITATLACLCLLLWTSCTDISILSYDMSFATAELTISATSNPDTSFVLTSASINPTEEMDKNGVSPDVIKKVTVETVTITLKSPETGNFDWAKDATVTISADSQPEIILGEVAMVDPGLTSLSAAVTGDDLTEYLKAGSFVLKLTATNDDIIPVDHRVEINTTFKVEI
jgi:hypothetical protein